jgi:multidrug efflux system membrane fusion protein
MKNVQGSPRRTTAWLAVALAIVPFSGCSKGKDARQQGRPPVPVLAAQAVSMNVPVRLSEIGSVEPYIAVSVVPRVGGQIEKIAFREGQDVHEGDMLFLIDPAPYEAQLAAAQANLARDRAKLANAISDQTRYADLVQKDYVTQQAYDAMVSTAEAARATVDADSADVVSARLNVQYCTIRAPIEGRTGNVLVQQGNVVKANDVPLVTINQITPVYVSFTIPESRLAEVRRYSEGGSLVVTATLPSDSTQAYEGKLTFLNNTVDDQTGTILLKATFPNQDHALWPGQFARVDLVLKEETGVTVVPASAVQPSQQGDFIFVVKPDSTVEMRSVVQGENTDGRVVISKGVEPGETVVTDGQLRLIPGAKVAIKSGLVPPAGPGQDGSTAGGSAGAAHP